jgi:hypothetical protein
MTKSVNSVVSKHGMIDIVVFVSSVCPDIFILVRIHSCNEVYNLVVIFHNYNLDKENLRIVHLEIYYWLYKRMRSDKFMSIKAYQKVVNRGFSF